MNRFIFYCVIAILVCALLSGCSENSKCDLQTTDSPSVNTLVPDAISVEDAKSIVAFDLPEDSYQYHIEFQREETAENSCYYCFHVYTLGKEMIEGDQGPYNQQFTYGWAYVNSQNGELMWDKIGIGLTTE